MIHKKHTGSIALISLLIISAISLMVVIAASNLSITGSYQAMHTSTALESYYMAEGCFEEAMYQLEADLAFTGTTLEYDTEQFCTITVSGISPMIVNINIENYNYTEKFSAEVNYTSSGEVNNFELLQWEKTV